MKDCLTLWRFVATILSLAVIELSAVRGQSELNGDKVVENAIEAWDRYTKKITNLQGKMIYEGGTSTEVYRKERYSLKKNGALIVAFVEIELSKKRNLSNKAIAFLSNGDYGAELKKSTSRSDWYISRFFPSQKAANQDVTRVLNTCRDAIAGLVLIKNIGFLKDIVREKEFRIKQCKPIKRGETEFVELEFDYHKSGFDFNGTLLLDLKQAKVPRFYHVAVGR